MGSWGKSHKIMLPCAPPPMTGFPWGFWLSELSTLSLQQLVGSSSEEPPQPWFPQEFPPVSLLWSAMMPWIGLPFSPVSGAAVCPVPSPFLQVQEELLIFSQYYFLHIVRMEWQLPSSLLETRRLNFCGHKSLTSKKVSILQYVSKMSKISKMSISMSSGERPCGFLSWLCQIKITSCL